MITIDFQSFWFEEDEKKDSCIEFVQNLLGPAENVKILKEDENDPESSFKVHLNYSKFTLNDFKFYDELMDFAREIEIYVFLFDHNTKSRKAYEYDEDDDWFEEELFDTTDYQL